MGVARDAEANQRALGILQTLFFNMGSCKFTVDGRVERVGSGSLVFVPRGTLLGFRNSTGTSFLFGALE
jgi:hypothetical protein